MNDLVSLYALQRDAGLHRDVLQRICRRSGIPVRHVRVSTPRYRVRVIECDQVEKLLRLAASYPRRKRHREASCPACGARLAITSGSTT